MKINSFTKRFIAGVLLSTSIGTASAAIVTEMGTDVTFTYDDSLLGLFGAPTIIGNSINFLPSNFIAKSENGAGVDQTSDTIVLTIESKNGSGFTLDKLLVRESGDYQLIGTGSSVHASLLTQVRSNTQVDSFGFPEKSIDLVQTPTITSPNDGQTTLWGLASMNDWLWGDETSISLTIENILTAITSDVSSLAFIEKKDLAISIEVNPVPIPGAVWFLGAGIAGLVGFARRREVTA